MKKVVISDAQHRALLQAIAWVESFGDESELLQTMTAKERKAFQQAKRNLRSAPDTFFKPPAPRGLSR